MTSSTTKPEFSVHLMPTAPVGEVVELAVLAESLGAHRCWLNDEGLATRDPYVTLTAIAARTERLLLGPGIANPYTRHPAVTIAGIASLDEYSGGRAFLGLGAGGGLAMGPMRLERPTPVATVEEMLAAARKLLAGRTVDHDGDVFGLRGARLAYGRSDLEILLAGRGPRMLALAGRSADGANLGYLHKSLLGDTVAALRSASGDRPFTVTYTTMLVRNEADLAAARAGLTFRLIDSPPEVRERLGVGPNRVAALREALARGGPAAAAPLVDEAWVEQFMIVGDPDDCAEEVRRLMGVCDIDEFQLPVSDVSTGAELVEQVASWF